MAPPSPLSGLVLCGGASRRMGRDKALVEVGGETLLSRVANRLAEVPDPVWLATGTPRRLGKQPFAEVVDARRPDGRGAGPIGGIVGGLRASRSPAVAVVAVDLPFLSGPLLVWLHQQWGGEAAVVPVDAAGRPQPLHAVFSSSAAEDLFVAAGQGKGGVLDVVLMSGGRLVTAPGRFGRDWPLNVNSPADIAAVSEVLARGG